IYAQNVNFDGTLGNTTEVEPRGSSQPAEFSLSQNYPNPFNPITKIQFTIPVGTYGRTSLRVYDILGREVATLVNEELRAGNHDATFDASSLASGVYFYRLTSGSFSATRKLLLLK
ncbi:MAG: T9SS type A sorting domain-containing protein, partial [Bacteroidota bacterium]